MSITNPSHSASRYPVYLRSAVALAVLATSALVVQAATNDTPSAPERAASKAEAVVSDSWITTKVKGVQSVDTSGLAIAG